MNDFGKLDFSAKNGHQKLYKWLKMPLAFGIVFQGKHSFLRAFFVDLFEKYINLQNKQKNGENESIRMHREPQCAYI